MVPDRALAGMDTKEENGQHRRHREAQGSSLSAEILSTDSTSPTISVDRARQRTCVAICEHAWIYSVSLSIAANTAGWSLAPALLTPHHWRGFLN